MGRPFRNLSAFGKRIEYWIVGKMLKEGLDVYLPLVDDDAVDAVIKRPDGRFIEIQIKARAESGYWYILGFSPQQKQWLTAQTVPAPEGVVFGNSGGFAAIKHEWRPDYWFVFYSERLDTMWIMSSDEFLVEATQNKAGKNVGKRSLWFNGKRKNKDTGEPEEYVKEKYKKYVQTDFSRLRT